MSEPQPELMTRGEVAELLRVSVRGLAVLRRRRPLACYRFGRAVRFRREDVEAWIESFRQPEAAHPTARAGAAFGAPHAPRPRPRGASPATAWDEVLERVAKA